jgi:transcriptional regulator with XRE-family HTH domain
MTRACSASANGLPGQWLRESRQAAALTQEELAERSGLAVRTIRNLELGLSPRPHPRSIRLLVQALGAAPAAADQVIGQYRNGRAPTGRWPAVPRQLPPGPRHFVGRGTALESLGVLLRESGDAGGVAVGAVSGMAGVGKTTLALHWAHEVAGRFPDGQLYINLGGFGPAGKLVHPYEALGRFLHGLGTAPREIPRSFEARTGLYRSLVADRRMLIVLDNARDAEQVRPLVPSSRGCVVLVTSRARLAGLAVAGNAEMLALDVLSDAEARDLLSLRVGGDRLAREPEAASELVRLCARLPLALAIAGARANAYPELPLAGLAAELGAAGRLDGLNAGDAATSVRAVFSWSYEQLPGRLARILRLLAIHPGPSITAAATASVAGISLGESRQALRILADASLVAERAPGRYGLHELVRAFAAEQAPAPGPAEDRLAAANRMLDHYLQTASAADAIVGWKDDPVGRLAPRPGTSPELLTTREQALAWLEAEHEVLVRVTRRAADAGFDAHAWQLALSLAAFLRMRGHWDDLVVTRRVAVAAARRLHDEDAQARIRRELGFGGCGPSVPPRPRSPRPGAEAVRPPRPSGGLSRSSGRQVTGGLAARFTGLRGAHLCYEPVEHRIDAFAADRLDCGLPHLPPVDEASAEQGFDQLEIEATVFFERAELLEVVEFPVQDVCLNRVLRDKPLHRVPKRFWRLELCDEAACFHERGFVPAPEEFDRRRRLTADPGFTGLPAGEDHCADRAQ